MPRALRRLAASLIICQLGLVHGGGLLFAYQEQAGGAGLNCGRSCCHLAKAGSPSASACCAVRCGEDVGKPGSEPARKRISPELLQAPALESSPLINVADSLPDRRVASERVSRPFLDGQPDLNVKHSVFLV